jgi:hypothetical protein
MPNIIYEKKSPHEVIVSRIMHNLSLTSNRINHITIQHTTRTLIHVMREMTIPENDLQGVIIRLAKIRVKEPYIGFGLDDEISRLLGDLESRS